MQIIAPPFHKLILRLYNFPKNGTLVQCRVSAGLRAYSVGTLQNFTILTTFNHKKKHLQTVNNALGLTESFISSPSKPNWQSGGIPGVGSRFGRFCKGTAYYCTLSNIRTLQFIRLRDYLWKAKSR